MVLINRQVTSLSAVYEMLADGKSVFAPADPATGFQSLLQISRILHWRYPGFRSGLDWNELDFAVATMEAWSGGRNSDRFYHLIPTEEVPMPSCFLSCLRRYAQSKGCTLKWELVPDVLFAHYKGEASPREKLFANTEFRATALKLSLV